MVKEVSNHFPDREFSRSDSGTHGLTAEGRLSASWIVRRKRLLVDRLENGNCSLVLVAQEIGSARALRGEGGNLAKLEAPVGPIDALGDDVVLRHDG